MPDILWSFGIFRRADGRDLGVIREQLRIPHSTPLGVYCSVLISDVWDGSRTDYSVAPKHIVAWPPFHFTLPD